MIGVVVLLAGVAGLVAAALMLRSLGPGYRIARLLWAAPDRAVAEACEAARADRPGYVRVHGRISSEEEFPDEHDRPLVYRRTRYEIAERGHWRLADEDRAAVPFGVEQRGAFIAVDIEALGDGLVAVPRQAAGVASDLPPGLRDGVDPGTPARLVIEQVSAVEHATAAGVPALDDRGEPQLTSAPGRPLILTTLELPAAMRLLAAGKRRRLVLGGLLGVASLGLVAAGLVALVLGA